MSYDDSHHDMSYDCFSIVTLAIIFPGRFNQPLCINMINVDNLAVCANTQNR